jgi:hypothetical protein
MGTESVKTAANGKSSQMETQGILMAIIPMASTLPHQVAQDYGKIFKDRKQATGGTTYPIHQINANQPFTLRKGRPAGKGRKGCPSGLYHLKPLQSTNKNCEIKNNGNP